LTKFSEPSKGGAEMKEKSILVSVRVSPELYKEVKKAAIDRDDNVTAIVKKAFIDYIREGRNMTLKDYWSFIKENPVIATVDSDHSCMNFKIAKGLNGISIIVDDSTAKKEDDRFYIAAQERTEEKMIEWLEKWGYKEFPYESVEKMKKIISKN
jgi:predicted transcriptional regulator